MSNEQVAASKPYVVSADLGLLLTQWTKKAGLIAPSQEFLAKLREDFSNRLREIFPDFILLDETILKEGLEKRIESYGLPLVALDRAYTPEAHHIDLCRVVNDQLEDAGVEERPGTSALETQLDYIVWHANGSQVVLADDVIFEGKGACEAIGHLKRRGISVRAVCAAVGVRSGVERVAQQVESVECVYSFDDVEDEICERDFYPGIPFSGRTLRGSRNVGSPYVVPFGKPEKWATIPPAEVDGFSAFCVRQTVRLFEEIERCSGRTISCRDLPRLVHNLPQGDERFVDALQQKFASG